MWWLNNPQKTHKKDHRFSLECESLDEDAHCNTVGFPLMFSFNIFYDVFAHYIVDSSCFANSYREHLLTEASLFWAEKVLNILKQQWYTGVLFLP